MESSNINKFSDKDNLTFTTKSRYHFNYFLKFGFSTILLPLIVQILVENLVVASLAGTTQYYIRVKH